MLANFVRCTHNGTGGSGALTLARANGWPYYADAFGSTGTRVLDYVILEYSDSTQATLIQAESGTSTVTLSTPSLARTLVKSTWVASGNVYTPPAGGTGTAAALTIGNTAENVVIMLAPAAERSMTGLPGPGWASGLADAFGVCAANLTAVNANASADTFGTIYYTPVLLTRGGAYSRFGFRQTATLVGTTATLDLALYEVLTDGTPGQRIMQFSQVTITSASAANFQSAALASPVTIPAGWYWMAHLWVANGTTGTPTFKGATICGGHPGGVALSATNGIIAVVAGATAQTALPASGWTTPVARVGTINAPLIGFV